MLWPLALSNSFLFAALTSASLSSFVPDAIWILSAEEGPHLRGSPILGLVGDASVVRLLLAEAVRILPAVSLPMKLLASPCKPVQLPPHILAKLAGDPILPPLLASVSRLKLLRGASRTPVLEGCLLGSGEVGLDPLGDAILVLGALVTSRPSSSSSLRPDISRRARGLSLSVAGIEEVLEEALAG
jgi:hypothetical protein